MVDCNQCEENHILQTNNLGYVETKNVTNADYYPGSSRVDSVSTVVNFPIHLQKTEKHRKSLKRKIGEAWWFQTSSCSLNMGKKKIKM